VQFGHLIFVSSLGLLVGTLWWFAFKPMAVVVGRLILRPSRRKPRQRWQKGTQFVLSGQLPLAIWVAMVLPSPVLHGMLSFFLPGTTAAVGGVFALVAVLWELLTESKRRMAVERALLPVAVDNLLAHGSLDFATRMLEYTLHSPDPVFRLAAVRGLSELGTSTALKLLAQSCNDPDAEVRHASERGAESIRQASGDPHPISTSRMTEWIETHVDLTSKLEGLHGQDFKTAGRRIIELEHAMTEVMNAQVALRNAFPGCWCGGCKVRLKEVRYSRWRYVCCPVCGDIDQAEAPVRWVVGQIGSRAMKIEKRDRLVQVWDEASQYAIYAELDVLDVSSIGVSSPEEAVQRFLDEWSNHHPAGKGLEIRLADDLNLNPEILRRIQELSSPD
jgi:hypothetical protein